MVKLMGVGLLAGAALCGCALPLPGPSPATATASTSPVIDLPRYRCDEDIAFTVRFVDDSAVIDAGARGTEVLLRDAGGVTPQQSVYSNAHVRAEFGLGATGREAVLRYLSSQRVAQCVRE